MVISILPRTRIARSSATPWRRPEPKAQGCDHIATIILNQERVLRPGVYCLGLTITGFSRVTFMPSVYVIKNGPFLVALSSQIKGEGVSFYMQGLSFFLFDPLTKIELPLQPMDRWRVCSSLVRVRRASC